MITVPKRITPELLSFCATISRETPVFIRSTPAADAEPAWCFDNVMRTIARAGGERVFGWAIWHIPGLYFEAEHHGVWRSPEGELVDVSPQLGNATQILFLPDPGAVYDPTNFRPNIIADAGGDAIASEFVSMAARRIAIQHSYRTDEHFAPDYSEQDQRELDRIQVRLDEILASRGVL